MSGAACHQLPHRHLLQRTMQRKHHCTYAHSPCASIASPGYGESGSSSGKATKPPSGSRRSEYSTSLPCGV